MRSLLVYYSFSGNTKQVAELLVECLKEKEFVLAKIKEITRLWPNG